MNFADILKAAAHCEGFYAPNSPQVKACNPCDLKWGDVGHGFFGVEKLTIFGTVDAGWGACAKEFEKILTGTSHAGYTLDMTLEAMGLKYSGGDPNWPKDFCEILHIPETTTVRELARMVEAGSWPNA